MVFIPHHEQISFRLQTHFMLEIPPSLQTHFILDKARCLHFKHKGLRYFSLQATN